MSLSVVSDKLDLVIFGATGFTGKYTVKELVRILPEYPNLTWGIAGRSRDKLFSILKEVGFMTGVILTDVPIIIADIKDEESLLRMAQKAKVIVNCCGPYRFYGEAVVKACIRAKAHQVDITAEPQYMETIQLNYDAAAKDAGVYIINACGFDCIPNDLGVVFLESQFEGTVNSVESYLSFQPPKVYIGKSIVHYGTYESGIHVISNWNDIKTLRNKLYTEKIPVFTPKLMSRSIIHKNDKYGGWYLPFPGEDSFLVYKTQRFFYSLKKKRPIQMKTYIGCPYLLVTLCFALYAFLFAIAVRFESIKKLMLKHPKLFTFGAFSHEGPTEETSSTTGFQFVLHGKGWDESVADINSEPPNKSLSVKVSGYNPGYGATCVALVLSALTLLKEEDKVPGRGGVLTTGAAFSQTSLIKNLNEHNLKFEVLPETSKEAHLKLS